MLATPAQPKLQRREVELDFIRGIAILMVMDFHAPKSIFMAPFLWLGFQNFGWAGVDLFFVLSGFLVGGLLVKEWKQYGRIDGRHFLIRRGFKIWPQYYLFLFANLVTGHRTLHQLRGNLLNIQNYVGGIAHTWTLAVEEHAYLFLVALLALTVRFGVAMKHIFLAVSGVCITIVAWRFFLASCGVNTFTRTDTRLDGILYGFLLAILYHNAPEIFSRLQRWQHLWLGTLLAALLYLRLAPADRWWYGSLSCVFADAAGVAFLLLFYHHQPGRFRPVIYRLIAWVGLYSYGIYLWHVSVIASVLSIARRLPPRLGVVMEYTAPILLAAVFGIVTTKLVELPVLRLRERFFPKRVDSAVDLPGPIDFYA